LRWAAVHVGYATMQVNEMTEIDGETAWHFSFEVRTNRFADTFFRVRTRIDSFVSEDLTRTLFYKENKREGRTRRDIEVTFDWEKKEAIYTNFGDEDTPIELPEGPVLDPVGALYYFRSLPLSLFGEYEFSVTDGRRVVALSLDIDGWDWIDVPSGRFNAYRIKPQTGELGGVFEKSDDSDVWIWISRDRLIYPVQVQGEVLVGSFWAKLNKITLPGK